MRLSHCVVPAVLAVSAIACSRRDVARSDAPVVRIGTPSLVTDLLLRETWGYYEAQVAAFVFEGLTRVEPAGLVPSLARRWEAESEARVFRFALRSGVVFHDGTRFTAADVVRAWTEALRNSPTGVTHPWALDPIDGARALTRGETETLRGVEVVDDTTLLIRLDEPLAFFPLLLSLPQTAIPAAASESRRPRGTGPWRWVSGGSREDSDIRFARNDAYWGQPAGLDSLVYRFVPDSALRRAFESGQVDLVSDVPPELRTAWSLRDDVGFIESDALTSTRLVINMLEPVFRDVRIRRALNHAVPSAQLATGAGAPNPVRATGAIPPPLPGADPARAPYAYDPELARRLLREGGYPFDRPLRLWVPAPGMADYPADIGPLLREYFEAVGLTVDLTVGGDGIETALTRRLADLMLSVWVGDYRDADAYLYPLYHSAAAGSAGNEGWYRDAEIDRLIAASRSASDPDVRVGLLRAADSVVFTRAPVVFLWFTRSATAFSLRHVGWGDDPVISRFTELRLARRDDARP